MIILTVLAVRIICPKSINTTTDLHSAFANVTWDAPEVFGGNGLVDVDGTTDELWQLISIGDTVVAYDVYDTYGNIVTSCSFHIHVDGKFIRII